MAASETSDRRSQESNNQKDLHQEPPGAQNQGEADCLFPSYTSTQGFQLKLRGFRARCHSGEGVLVRCYRCSSSVWLLSMVLYTISTTMMLGGRGGVCARVSVCVRAYKHVQCRTGCRTRTIGMRWGLLWGPSGSCSARQATHPRSTETGKRRSRTSEGHLARTPGGRRQQVRSPL